MYKIDEIDNESKQNKQKSEYLKILRNGTGQWPLSIFSYDFKGFNQAYGSNNYDDLKYACKLVEDLGSNLYIRDNSYLGFPTYYVVVPGLSNLYNVSDLFLDDIKKDPIDFLSFLFSKTHAFDDDFLRIMIHKIENLIQKGEKFSFNDLFLFYTSKELKDLDPNLFLCMAFYKLNNFTKSLYYINAFLHNKGAEYAYFYAVADYIKLKYFESQTDGTITELLSTKYGMNIALEVISDIKNPANIFKYYNFEDHINFDSLDVNPDSLFMELLKINKKLEIARKNNRIEQQKLIKILSFD